MLTLQTNNTYSILYLIFKCDLINNYIKNAIKFYNKRFIIAKQHTLIIFRRFFTIN